MHQVGLPNGCKAFQKKSFPFWWSTRCLQISRGLFLQLALAFAFALVLLLFLLLPSFSWKHPSLNFLSTTAMANIFGLNGNWFQATVQKISTADLIMVGCFSGNWCIFQHCLHFTTHFGDITLISQHALCFSMARFCNVPCSSMARFCNVRCSSMA